MPDNASDQEPSIEEILASIRQIISDDDEQVAPVEAEAPPPPPPPAKKAAPPPPPPPEPEPEEEVLELTESMRETPRQPIEVDLREIEAEINARLDEPEPGPEPEPYEEIMSKEPIISGQTAASALGSMTKLAGRMPVSRTGDYRKYDGVTLEDIVHELLHPMLKEWMDKNLPDLVERLVQRELEKLARRARDE